MWLLFSVLFVQSALLLCKGGNHHKECHNYNKYECSKFEYDCRLPMNLY